MAKRSAVNLQDGNPGIDENPAIIDAGDGDNIDASGNSNNSGNGDSNGAIIGPKRRGPKPGQKRGKRAVGLTPEARDKAIRGTARLIVKAHSYASSPVWAMDMDEATELATCMQEVGEAWGFKPDPRVTATFNLLAAVIASYGSRVMAARMMRSMEQQPLTSEHVAAH